MRSGLRSYYSRSSAKPAKTNGATPNTAAGVLQTPQEKLANFSSPAVSASTLTSGFKRTPNVHVCHSTQVLDNGHELRPASPASSAGSSTLLGGRHRSSNSSARKNLTDNDTSFPVPCTTFQARLAESSLEVEANNRQSNDMKSVDKTATEFKMRFSGRPGEDWIGHIDVLETHRAQKFRWTARQFYHALLLTLLDPAKASASALEEDLKECDMPRLLPG